MNDEYIDNRFSELLEKMDDEQFWAWVKGWFSENFIMDTISDWDSETKKDEIKTMEEIINGEQA